MEMKERKERRRNMVMKGMEVKRGGEKRWRKY